MGLLDYFVEREPDTETKPDSTVPSLNLKKPYVPNLGTSSASSQPYVPSTSYVSQGDISVFDKHFDELFQNANLPGPDYFEFSKMCQVMNLPEDSKFPAVFAALGIQGLTKDKLLETAKHYIAVIEQDQQNFNVAFDSKIMNESKAKRATADQLDKKMEEKRQLILSLQKELDVDMNTVSNMRQEADIQEQKANEKAIIYKSACEARKQAINADILKINQLLKS